MEKTKSRVGSGGQEWYRRRWKYSALNRVGNRCHLSKELKEVRDFVIQTSKGIAFWAERTAIPKALMPDMFKKCQGSQCGWNIVGKMESRWKWTEKDNNIRLGRFHKSLQEIWFLLMVNCKAMENSEHRRYMILLTFQRISQVALSSIVWKKERAEVGRPVILAGADGDLDQCGGSDNGEK